MENKIGQLKNIFAEGDRFDYVNIDKSSIAYQKLLQAIEKPLKLILLYGKPGSGKTYLLKKLYKDFENSKKIFFYPTPFFDEIEFLKSLYVDIFGENAPSVASYDELLKIFISKFDQNNQNDSMVVLIDEAQLYPGLLLEKIRLLADSRKIKFIFTVHKTDKEDTLAKDYFTTRIWESIEIENATFQELKTYIEKKFLFYGYFEIINMLNDKIIKFIFNFTKGNFRETNKFMYKLFEIYEFYELNSPTKINNKKINFKFAEMVAIDLGFINA